MSIGDTTRCELLVVGGGLAGLAAAWRASDLGIATAVVAASPGSLPYTSGALDLLGVYPTVTKRYRTHPWEAVSELIEREPQHPYGRVGLGAVRRAVEAFFAFLEESPLAYYRKGEENLAIITCAGTVKPTFGVAGTMRNNAAAWEARRPTLVVGFRGFPDFSPEQVAQNLRARWPGIRATRLDPDVFETPPVRVTGPVLAAAFEKPTFRDRFVERIEPLLQGARFLGVPSVLGYDRAMAIVEELGERLGVQAFEIPLLSPALPGFRLAEYLQEELRRRGVDYRQGAAIASIEAHETRLGTAIRRGRSQDEAIEADAVVLASGRFFGGGLDASQSDVKEPLLGLPIDAPPLRDDWHMSTFLGAPGHPINRVGVVVDKQLQPVDGDGKVLFENLYAAGGILSDHDWVREKAGAGISIATGIAAVDSFHRHQVKA